MSVKVIGIQHGEGVSVVGICGREGEIEKVNHRCEGSIVVSESKCELNTEKRGVVWFKGEEGEHRDV